MLPVPVTAAKLVAVFALTVTLLASVVTVYEVVPAAKLGEILYPLMDRLLKLLFVFLLIVCVTQLLLALFKFVVAVLVALT